MPLILIFCRCGEILNTQVELASLGALVVCDNTPIDLQQFNPPYGTPQIGVFQMPKKNILCFQFSSLLYTVIHATDISDCLFKLKNHIVCWCKFLEIVVKFIIHIWWFLCLWFWSLIFFIEILNVYLNVLLFKIVLSEPSFFYPLE